MSAMSFPARSVCIEGLNPSHYLSRQEARP